MNTTIPETLVPLSGFPTVPRIPAHIQSLSECAQFEVNKLMENPLLDEDALDDGFLLCDLNVVYQKLVAWRHLFPRVKPFYALKCHPDENVARVLADSGGAGFDCASVAEMELALTAQSDPCSVVYANPQRAENHLVQALQLGTKALTFDGVEELNKIDWACRQANVGDRPTMILRILVPDGDSIVPLGEKFGAPLEGVDRLVARAMELDLPIKGVSFHSGSGNHSPKAYETAIHLAAQAIERINELQPGNLCQLLDLGGGYPGRDGYLSESERFAGTKSPERANGCTAGTTSEIAATVSPLLDRLFPKEVQIISEPGRYFVEGAFALCSPIYRVEEEDGVRHYFIPQGVEGVFKDCILCNEVFVPEPLVPDRQLEVELYPSCVHGPSGRDVDIICRDHPMPKLLEGDWLVFDRMGAYTMSIAARHGRPPVRYVIGGSHPSIV